MAVDRRYPLAGRGDFTLSLFERHLPPHTAGGCDPDEERAPMFSHVMLGSNDIARSKKFYDALFAAMGAQPGAEVGNDRLLYTHNGGRFLVTKPIDGKPASHANGGTIGFTMS